MGNAILSLEYNLSHLLQSLACKPDSAAMLLELDSLSLDFNFIMDGLDTLSLIKTAAPIYTVEMMSQYWQYLDDRYDSSEYPSADVDNDITVMENTLLPTEQHFLLHHRDRPDIISQYRADKIKFDALYAPVKVIPLFNN